MAENYSLNSRFGLNVSNQNAKSQNTQNYTDTLKNAAGLFDTVSGFVSKYENVFNGNIEREINMYSRQAMIVGMNLKAADTKHSFDVNI